MKVQRIAVLTLYYPPEIFGNAPIVRTVVREFSRRGARVDIVTMPPHRRVDPTQKVCLPQGANIHYVGIPKTSRGIGGQLRNWWSFARGAASWLSCQEPLVALSITPPFFLPAVLHKAVKRRGHRLIHWLQDMYPAAIEVGTASSTLARSVITHIARRSLRVPEAIISVTEDWRDDLINQLGVPQSKLHFCENWCGVELNESRDRNRSSKRRLLFAGNVGRIADMQTVMKALHLLKDEDWLLDICGSGAAVDEVKELARPISNRVCFHGDVPEAELGKYYSKASIGLVPLRKGATRASVPSKTYSYFASALPVLTAVDEGSHFDRLVRSEGVGWCAKSGDVNDIARALRDAIEAPDAELAKLGANARALYERHYSPEVGAARFADLMESLL